METHESSCWRASSHTLAHLCGCARNCATRALARRVARKHMLARRPMYKQQSGNGAHLAAAHRPVSIARARASSHASFQRYILHLSTQFPSSSVGSSSCELGDAFKHVFEHLFRVPDIEPFAHCMRAFRCIPPVGVTNCIQRETNDSVGL